jgi:hypothetical protein
MFRITRDLLCNGLLIFAYSREKRLKTRSTSSISPRAAAGSGRAAGLAEPASCVRTGDSNYSGRSGRKKGPREKRDGAREVFSGRARNEVIPINLHVFRFRKSPLLISITASSLRAASWAEFWKFSRSRVKLLLTQDSPCGHLPASSSTPVLSRVVPI